MTPSAPLYDASIAGAIAATNLVASSLVAASLATCDCRPPASLAAATDQAPPARARQSLVRRRGWLAAAFDLVSGPEAPPRSGASNI